ncbi:MAG: hypothetical protein GY762_24120 [Proteobacteria bacterium]|nr:hypothetical protein [Pseudomonadota bacterium]
MKRLEIIHVRLTNAKSSCLIEDVHNSILSKLDFISVRFYHHATVATDLSIHIHLEIDEINKDADSLGTRLAAALRDHGMVEHTFWIEEETGGVTPLVCSRI